MTSDRPRWQVPTDPTGTPAAPPPVRRSRRWVLWVVVGLAVVVVFIVASSTPRPPGPGPVLLPTAPTVTAGPIAAPSPSGARDVVYGQVVDYDGWQVTAGAPVAGAGVFGPVWCSQVVYANNTDDEHPFNPLDWSVRDPAGADTPASFSGSSAAGALQYGRLQPGGTTGGAVCFDKRGPTPPAAVVYAGLLLVVAKDRASWHAA